jgi:branched-chain amino acid transport system substrate-binding protein
MRTTFLFWAFNVVSLLTLLLLLAMVRKDTTVQVRFLMLFALVVGVGYYFFSERSAFYIHTSAARTSHSLESTGPIDLAAVWDNQEDGFFRGVQLAVEEINARGGVALDPERSGRSARPIRLSRFFERDGQESDKVQYELARQVAIVAVVGHRSAEQAISASLTYDNNKLLYLASTVSDPRLTGHGFRNVFRSIPDDKQLAGALVAYCRNRGAGRIALLYPRTPYGNTLAAIFRDRLRASNPNVEDREHALSIATMQSYAPGEDDFSALVSNLGNYQYDAILIADALPRAGALIREIRMRGIDQLIIGSDAMASPRLWEASGGQARDVVVASLLPADGTAPAAMAVEFARNYLARYGMPPDNWASEGYEAVRLLAQAWERAGTTLPAAVGSALRAYRGWRGLYGEYGFGQDGEVLDRPVYLKQMQQGQFVAVGSFGRSSDDGIGVELPGAGGKGRQQGSQRRGRGFPAAARWRRRAQRVRRRSHDTG